MDPGSQSQWKTVENGWGTQSCWAPDATTVSSFPRKSFSNRNVQKREETTQYSNQRPTEDEKKNEKDTEKNEKDTGKTSDKDTRKNTYDLNDFRLRSREPEDQKDNGKTSTLKDQKRDGKKHHRKDGRKKDEKKDRKKNRKDRKHHRKDGKKDKRHHQKKDHQIEKSNGETTEIGNWTEQSQTLNLRIDPGEQSIIDQMTLTSTAFDRKENGKDTGKTSTRKDEKTNMKRHHQRNILKTSGYVNRDGTKIFYQIVGKPFVPKEGRKGYTTPRPTMIFIHEGNLDHTVWKHQQEYFSKYTQTLAFDLRGCGQSGCPTDPLSIDIHVMDLHFLLQELKIDDFILIGWSIGGAVALSFLHSYPGKAKKAVLLNTTSQSFADEHYRWGRTSQQQSDLLALIESDFPKYLQVETQAVIPEIAEGSDRVREQIRSLIEQNGKEIVRRQTEDFNSFSLHRDLSSIQTEILILCGGQDQVIDPRNSFDLRLHLPHSGIVELPQAGHAPHLTFAYEFNRLVSNFAQGRKMKCSILS